MKTQSELRSELDNFYGSEEFTRYSPLIFPKVILTEGTKYVADEWKAYWLMDAISSHLPKAGDGFVVVKLTKDRDAATLSLADDDPPTKVYARQKIEYTDFPLDEITLFAIYDAKYWTILLPSEY